MAASPRPGRRYRRSRPVRQPYALQRRTRRSDGTRATSCWSPPSYAPSRGPRSTRRAEGVPGLTNTAARSSNRAAPPSAFQRSIAYGHVVETIFIAVTFIV